MRISWDENKNAINRTKHGVDFALFVRLFDGEFIVAPAKPKDGEMRWQVMAKINSRVITAIYEMRGTWYRVLSMRKAKTRGKEKRLFEQSQKRRKEKGRIPHQL